MRIGIEISKHFPSDKHEIESMLSFWMLSIRHSLWQLISYNPDFKIRVDTIERDSRFFSSEISRLWVALNRVFLSTTPMGKIKWKFLIPLIKSGKVGHMVSSLEITKESTPEQVWKMFRLLLRDCWVIDEKKKWNSRNKLKQIEKKLHKANCAIRVLNTKNIWLIWEKEDLLKKIKKLQGEIDLLNIKTLQVNEWSELTHKAFMLFELEFEFWYDYFSHSIHYIRSRSFSIFYSKEYETDFISKMLKFDHRYACALLKIMKSKQAEWLRYWTSDWDWNSFCFDFGNPDIQIRNLHYEKNFAGWDWSISISW